MINFRRQKICPASRIRRTGRICRSSLIENCVNFMNHEVLEKLKLKRKEIAERESKKLFMIFHNAVLERTAEVLPKTKDDLADIKGWGKRKIEKYGDEILAIINGEQETPISNDKIFSVQEFISFINNQFSSLGIVKVRGEITEVNPHPNGYCFFTIKDSQTEEHSVSCYLSRWKIDSFSHLLEVGMEVVVSATPSLYKNGRFSLTVNAIEPFGEGALKKAFEALKKKLAAKGYFDPARKRLLPEFMQKIGLITSESGAAIRDFRKNLGEYGFKIYLLDVRVEGDYAEESICSAIKWFNKNKPEIDVLVLIRGGGDLENLKAFNSESVAEAIGLSRLPIITGIGHEKDETIADYAADKSFSTPTAAAMFIRTQRENLIAQVKEYADNLVLITGEIFADKKDYVLDRAGDLKIAFDRVLERYKFILSKTAEKMTSGFNKIFRGFKLLEQNFLTLFYRYKTAARQQFHNLEIISQKCFNLMEKKLSLMEARLKAAEAGLLPLNPDAILKRGFSVVYKVDKKVIKDSKEVVVGDKIFIKPHKGEIASLVEEVKD